MAKDQDVVVDTANQPAAQGASPQAQAVGVASASPHRGSAEDTPHCRCTHPLHPDRRQVQQGVPMERYSCPLRRWWNFWKHPRVWMPARQNVAP
ncbi:MAG TPA: hypothetical protein VFS20_26460 [Longimicrobium sp.]|nr:hypothetical protein [Longimicrobium sp.]